MYNMNLAVGPCAVHLETDENLSFDAIDSLLNRGTLTVLTLMNAHMGAMVKYENYDNDIEEDLDGIVEFPNKITE
jgi:hypothetical protein